MSQLYIAFSHYYSDINNSTPEDIYLFKVRVKTMEKGKKYVQS